jgi:ethanolamine utilization protein EutQ (cupin superfamily)
MMESYKIDFTSIPWESPMPGLRGKAHRRDGRQLRLAEYTRHMAPHWCERGHIGYILDGQFEIRFEHQTLVFKPGDGVFIPPGPAHKHMARALSDTVRVVFVEEV